MEERSKAQQKSSVNSSPKVNKKLNSPVTTNKESGYSTAKFGNSSTVKSASEVTFAQRGLASANSNESKRGDKLRRRREERQRKAHDVDTNIMMFADQHVMNQRLSSPQEITHTIPTV